MPGMVSSILMGGGGMRPAVRPPMMGNAQTALAPQAPQQPQPMFQHNQLMNDNFMKHQKMLNQNMMNASNVSDYMKPIPNPPLPKPTNTLGY